MSPELLIWVVLFGLLLLGVPIFVAIGAAAIIVLMPSGIPLKIIPMDLMKVSDMYPLLAVPTFILAGAIMEKGGMAHQIVEFAQAIVGRVRGGLGLVTIMGCVFFAAMIGSGPATVAAMGSLMIPSMLKHGYTMPYAVGVTSTGGTLGILIPPSNPMILYGVLANVSISGLFMAGFAPGFLLASVLMVTAYGLAVRGNFAVIQKKYTGREVFRSLLRNVWSLMAPVIILGGIYSGIFTPVEASVVAVIYALLVGTFITRQLKLSSLAECLDLTSRASGTMMIVVGVSVLFGRFLTLYRIPQSLAGFLLSITDNPLMVLALILLLLFFLGMFMDTLATIVILAPVLVPVVVQFGIDPIFFGVLWIIINETALLTPPLGPNVFIAMNLTGLSLEEASKAVLPYLAVLIVLVITLMIFGEKLILFLPRMLL